MCRIGFNAALKDSVDTIQKKFGAGGGNRTPTPFLAPDFESGTSTSSITPAIHVLQNSILASRINDVLFRLLRSGAHYAQNSYAHQATITTF
jgi:hypothetical protein